MKKILLADDHSITRRGLKFLLTTQFSDFSIAETQCINDTVIHLKEHPCDFAIFDLQLSDGNMIEALPNIIAQFPKVHILVYSMCNEEIYGRRLLQMGCKGYLNKNEDEEEVIRALQVFLSGHNYMSYRLNNLLVSELRSSKNKQPENPFITLSNREVEVTHHLLIGKGVKEISMQMHLHANTVVTYKNRIFEKLSIHNLVDLNNLAKLYHFN
jgi:DNA-binding NarL/FixJ family response regulator